MRPLRPRERPRGTPEEEVANRRTRALEDPLDVRRIPDARFLRLEVRNPVHRTRYDVLFPAFPDRDGEFCTCADFARRSVGTCKHLEAGWIWLADNPPTAEDPPPSVDPDPVWEDVDRRLKGVGRTRLPPSLRLRYPGRALLEDLPT
jgi:hypothetical protein